MRPVTAPFCVKGSSIRSKFDYVRDAFGSASELELRESLAKQTDLSTVLDSGLYPFELYDRVLRAIADRFFDGDLSRLQEVGAYSAQRSLTTIYRAFADGKDFLGFLARIQTLHQRFYTHGRMEVLVAEDGKSARISLNGAPSYSEADLHVAAGFYRGAGQLLGLEKISHRFEQNENGADFFLSWA